MRSRLLVGGVLFTLVGYRRSRRHLVGVLAAVLVPAVVATGFWAGLGRSAAVHPTSLPQAVLSITAPATQAPASDPATPTPSQDQPPPSGPAPAGSPYTSAATAPRHANGHSGPTIVGRLLVSTIHINMAVEAVGTNVRGEMGIPVNPNNAGWWQPGYAPGQAGHVVVDGHVNWYTGPGPFRDLHKLHPGDLITLSWGDGQAYTYSVTGSTTYAWNASVPDAFGPASRSTLVLITCAGTWDAAHQRYTGRLIVQAQIT